MGPGDKQLGVLKELADTIVKPLSFYLWHLLIIEGGSWKLEETKCHSRLQEGQEGRYKELHLKPCAINGATDPGKCFQEHKWQVGDQELFVDIWFYLSLSFSPFTNNHIYFGLYWCKCKARLKDNFTHELMITTKGRQWETNCKCYS